MSYNISKRVIVKINNRQKEIICTIEGNCISIENNLRLSKKRRFYIMKNFVRLNSPIGKTIAKFENNMTYTKKWNEEEWVPHYFLHNKELRMKHSYGKEAYLIIGNRFIWISYNEVRYIVEGELSREQLMAFICLIGS